MWAQEKQKKKVKYLKCKRSSKKKKKKQRERERGAKNEKKLLPLVFFFYFKKRALTLTGVPSKCCSLRCFPRFYLNFSYCCDYYCAKHCRKFMECECFWCSYYSEIYRIFKTKSVGKFPFSS